MRISSGQNAHLVFTTLHIVSVKSDTVFRKPNRNGTIIENHAPHIRNLQKIRIFARE